MSLASHGGGGGDTGGGGYRGDGGQAWHANDPWFVKAFISTASHRLTTVNT